MGNLILLRHGESRWNVEGRFTGWVDISLTEKGVQEAKCAGKSLASFGVDCIFTSVLSRALITAMLVGREQKGVNSILMRSRLPKGYQENFCSSPRFKEGVLPLISSSCLNERFYGDLQGLYKKQAAKKWGEEQVNLWRRSFSVSPPGGENLSDTCKRVVPFFQEKIVPLVAQGATVLVVAHMNSLRAILMVVEELSSETIMHRELKTGKLAHYNYVSSWGTLWEE